MRVSQSLGYDKNQLEQAPEGERFQCDLVEIGMLGFGKYFLIHGTWLSLCKFLLSV